MHELVKDYYGKQLAGSADLKSSACCDASSVLGWLKPLLAKIHPEVLERLDGRPCYAKRSIDGGKQVENAAIDPDFDRGFSPCP